MNLREPPSMHPGTILYVDDDEANLVVFAALCEGKFDVMTASRGRVALDLLGTREIAVLLADQRMPEMTGVELLERVCREFPETDRLLVTAYADLSDAVEAINRGHIRRYFRKPWEPRDLEATLLESLENHRVRKKLAELERRLVETERVYALGVVAACVAHELRTPLSVLVGMLDLAAMRADSLAAALEPGRTLVAKDVLSIHEVANFIAEARGSASQLIDITKGIEVANRRRDEESSSDLNEVLRLTLRSVKGALSERARIEVTTVELPWVVGSSTKLGQIALNLIVNALEALPDRPASENRIAISLGREDNTVLLSIEDNGPGIEPAAASRVFDPFFTTKKNGGTGLGLAISKRIIEELGGRIELSTELGRGTRFIVSLPIGRTP